MATPANHLSLLCPAKLNLTLAVGPPRHDGLHPIASVMAAVGFGDDLRLRRLDDGPSRFTRRFADDAPKPQPIDWPIESDLIYRAHGMMEQAAGRALPIDVTLDKRIPAGAGLGGGSSNAAAMIVGLRDLFRLNVPDDALLSMAGELGADVTFLTHALLGRPAARVTGIGEIIEPLTALPAFHAVLILPDGVCPTTAVYSAFDENLPDDAEPISEQLIRSWSDSDLLPPAHNDLTEAAKQVCPAITAAMDAAQSQGAEPRLTGSGSALFVITDTHEAAETLAARFNASGTIACATRHR